MLTQKCLLVSICLLLGLNSFAQKESKKGPKIHEIGFSITSGLDFGFIYKTGTEKSVLRLQALFLNGSNQIQSGGSNNNYGVGFSLGREYRTNIVDNLFFIYGFGGGLSYSGQSAASSGFVGASAHIFSPKINLILGFNYVLKERWIFSIETLPYLQSDIGLQSIGGNLDINNVVISYGLNMASVRLVIAHRFGKK